MQPRRGRIGCLGQLALLGLLLAVIGMGVVALTNPWIFTVGGHFRLLPFWQGVGDIQGPGGTYRIFVSFQPSSSRSRLLPSTSVTGSGWICAPSGHTYNVRLGGGAHKVVWRDMDNEPFTLYTYQRGAWSTQHLPPKLSFVGAWVGASLVMDDKGTTAAAFMVDGSLNPRAGAPGARRSVTFVEKQWWLGHPCPVRGEGRAE